MKADFIQEPELEFGTGRHVDIRFGLMSYGVFDYADALAPKHIKVGIVGTPETVEGTQGWLHYCRDDIPAKPSNQPNLFPKFPGFRPEVGFHSTLVLNTQLQRTIAQREFRKFTKKHRLREIVNEAVELFFSELQYLAQNQAPDVLICAVPMELLNLMEAENEDEETRENGESSEKSAIHRAPDFHDLLKARSMSLMKPIQLVLPSTYDPSKRRQQKGRPDRARKIQDEATVAWNFHTALYYKAGGIPRRLIHDSTQLTACHVGVSFYQSLDQSTLQTSVAQVFNERGHGVIVRGGSAQISRENRQPYLQATTAYQLLTDALLRYREEHQALPARVVMHKSSNYRSSEMEGFTQALDEQRISTADFISIGRTFTRLFRHGDYPPLRGTLLSLDDSSHILYTRGSVDFFATYPGMYVPHPLLFRCAQTEQTPRFLAQEMLGSTKMNWNNTQFDGAEPITSRGARQVGRILKYVDQGQRVEPRYSFYM